MLIILLVSLIIIIGLTMGGREKIGAFENLIGKALTPIQTVFDSVSKMADSMFSPIFNIWQNKKTIEELELENNSLYKKIIDITLENNEYEELKELREVFNYLNDDYKDKILESKVIAKEPGNWYNMFTIDLGTKDGMTKNSIVINGDGLVGLVYEVGSTWSKVISAIDNKSSIGFEIVDTKRNYEGITDGGIDGTLKGTLFDPKCEVEIGDLVCTSGKGLYYEGIIIGTVEEILVDKDELLIRIIIKPYVNFKKLSRVLVIPSKDIVGE